MQNKRHSVDYNRFREFMVAPESRLDVEENRKSSMIFLLVDLGNKGKYNAASQCRKRNNEKMLKLLQY